MDLTTFLGYASGLTLVNPPLAPSAVLGTGLVVQICHAIVCRLFAHNRGYPKNLCTACGLVGGVWAVTILILLPRRRQIPPPARPLP